MTIALELGKTLGELDAMTLHEECLWLARFRYDAKKATQRG